MPARVVRGKATKRLPCRRQKQGKQRLGEQGLPPQTPRHSLGALLIDAPFATPHAPPCNGRPPAATWAMPAPSRNAPPFDASIALRQAELPAGMDPETAVQLARTGIATLPGAGAIRVDFVGGDPVSHSPAIQVWERGHSVPHDDADAIAIAIRKVLDSTLHLRPDVD